MLFLIDVTASEFSQLLGPAEMRLPLFAYRPSELQLKGASALASERA